MGKERMIKIVRLQENLGSIRRIAGWTAEGFGSMLAVSKQNISNLENKNTKLSQAQYIAIRHLLDYQVKIDPENTTLPRIVGLLVDRLEIQGHEYDLLKSTAKDIGTAAATMKGRSLRIFADTLLKASYTSISDFTEIEGPLKAACETEETVDWTAEIAHEKNEED